jgi:hypothetical protein
MQQQTTAPMPPHAIDPRRPAGLDAAHAAVWDAISHLFPPHAMVNQTDEGYLVISWTLPGALGRCARFAAPLMIRIEPALLLALWTTDVIERKAIARLQARVVRRELTEYDPLARIPTARVIVLGEEVFA